MTCFQLYNKKPVENKIVQEQRTQKKKDKLS